MRGSSRSTQHTSSEYSSPPHHDRRSSLKRNAQRTITTARVRASRCESPRPRWMRQPESRWYTTSRNSRIGFDGTHIHTHTHTHTHPLVSFQPLAAYSAAQPCNRSRTHFAVMEGKLCRESGRVYRAATNTPTINRSCVCVCRDQTSLPQSAQHRPPRGCTTHPQRTSLYDVAGFNPAQPSTPSATSKIDMTLTRQHPRICMEKQKVVWKGQTVYKRPSQPW
jgi:hypothetical protein